MWHELFLARVLDKHSSLSLNPATNKAEPTLPANRRHPIPHDDRSLMWAMFVSGDAARHPIADVQVQGWKLDL